MTTDKKFFEASDFHNWPDEGPTFMEGVAMIANKKFEKWLAEQNTCKHSPIQNVPVAHAEIVKNSWIARLYKTDESICANCGVKLKAVWSADE